MGGALALEAAYKANFGNMNKRSVRAIVFNPWTALHSDRYLAMGAINGHVGRPPVLIV